MAPRRGRHVFFRRPDGVTRSPGGGAHEREAIPALADKLLAQQPGRVHREIVTLVERALFAHVLDRLGGNQLRAVHALGLNRNTLRKRCVVLDLLATNPSTTRPPPAKIS